ncbi:MAG: allantoinase AllB, partial [Thermoproteota archaeon]
GHEVLDARGMLVLPGVVDEHVHMREPGLEYKDDFTHGTMAAAAGGVTTVIEMPNTLPPVEDADKLRRKADLLSGKAYVDFALLGVLHDENLDELEGMLEAGAVGFKAFLGPTTGNIPPPGDGSMYEALEKSSRLGFTIAFHGENWGLVRRFTERVKSEGRADPLAHLCSRPPVCEEEAAQRIALYARRTGGRALIVHVAAAEAIGVVRRARSDGVEVYAETCPHYLLLSADDYERYGALMKVNPPVRELEHQRELWRAVNDGTIQTLGSDHAPHSREEKSGDMMSAAAGVPAVQTFLPLMLDAALGGRMPITKIPELMARNPARLFGLYPRKGSLSVGSDGDLAIVDPRAEWTIRAEDLYAKHPITPFDGWRLRGRVAYTVVRGTIVAESGKVTVSEPRGEWVVRRA